MWRFVSGGKWRYLALSGLFFGLGAASKWTCIYAGGGPCGDLAHLLDNPAPARGLLAGFHLELPLLPRVFRRAPAGYILRKLLFLRHRPAGSGAAWACSSRATTSTSCGTTRCTCGSTTPTSWRSTPTPPAGISGWWTPGRYSITSSASDDGTKSAFGAFMNPIFCWAGLLAVVANAILAVKDRDGRALFIVTGYLAQLLPWVLVTRLTFAYHYFPCEVFMLLALCNVFTRLRERQPLDRQPADVCLHRGLRAAFHSLLPGAHRRAHAHLVHDGLPQVVPELAVLSRAGARTTFVWERYNTCSLQTIMYTAAAPLTRTARPACRRWPARSSGAG